MIIDETVASVDGRTQRRRRNIDAVVDAVIELARAGNLDPTSEEIAALAGISHRSIYRYYDTRAELLDAAVVRAFDAVSAEVFRDDARSGSFDERVEQFVAARIEMYRRLRSVVRMEVAHAAVDSSGTPGVDRARAVLRTRLVDLFIAEFDRFEPEERRLVAAVVDAAFQFEALEYLDANAGLDDDQIQRALALNLRRHLT